MFPCPVDNETLRSMFEHYTADQPKFTRRIAINMADTIGMPPMSLVWRLEKLGLLKRGSWDWFKANGGITKANIDEVRADRERLTAPRPTEGT